MKFSLLAAAAAIMALTCTASAAGFRTEADSVYNIPAAFDSKYTSVEWSYVPQTDAVVGAPLASGGNVYFAADDVLYCKNEADGSDISSVSLPEKCSQYSGAIIGNTLIQPTESGVCTVNIKTMELISQRNFGAEITSTIAADGNLAYITTKSENGETLHCTDLSDNLNTVWEYSAGSITPLSTLDGRIVFGAGEALVSADMKTGSASEIALNKSVISAPFSTQYAVYFSCADGSVGKARLNSDGSFEDSVTYCELGAGGLSSPLVWNSDLYVCSENGLYMLDSLNMEQERLFEEIKCGVSPWLCTGNGEQLYTVAKYDDLLVLYCMNINKELDEPIINKLAKLENFDNGTVSPSDSGIMFFRDGYGRIHALKEVGYDWFSIIIKVVLFVALVVLVFFWLRAWRKSKNPQRPLF